MSGGSRPPVAAIQGAFTWDALTDIGLARHENQDAFAVAPERGLFAVCDGMGAHARGAAASVAACEAIRSVVAAAPRATRAETARALLSQAIHVANERVQGLGNGTRRPGTTVAALLVVGESVVIAHVGDSRVYRLRGGVLKQMTHDHSLMNYFLAQGLIRPEEAASHPQRNVITRALGMSATVEPDLAISVVRPGDVFLLCSDGLAPLGQEVVRWCLRMIPRRAVRELTRLTLAAGAPDNLTSVVVSFAGGAA